MPIVIPPVPCNETVLVVTPSNVTPTDIPVTIPVPLKLSSPLALPSGRNTKLRLEPCVKDDCCADLFHHNSYQ